MAIGSWRNPGQQPQRARRPAAPPAGSPLFTGFTEKAAAALEANNEKLRDTIAVLGGDPDGAKEPTSSSGSAQDAARSSSGQSVKVSE